MLKDIFRLIRSGSSTSSVISVFLTVALLFIVGACSFPFPSVENGATSDAIRDCTFVVPNENPRIDPYETIIEPFDLVAPSGNRIYGLIRHPDPALYPNLCFPAVVFVAGGTNPGRMMAHGDEARSLSGAGMVVLTFNAEGRIDDMGSEDILSEGSEDFNGYRNQDGLCEIIKYAMDLIYVIPSNVGIKTQSYGITMVAGCASRYPEIPIKYIVDGEGPSDSFVTCHEPRALNGDTERFDIVFDKFQRYSAWRDHSAENLAFWEQREAVKFIGNFRGRYLRLQAEWDHVQPPSSEDEITAYYLPEGCPNGGRPWWQGKHTADMVNAAIAGGVPWVRVNLPEHGNPVNATYDADHQPVYLPGWLADKPWSIRAVLEMARME